MYLFKTYFSFACLFLICVWAQDQDISSSIHPNHADSSQDSLLSSDANENATSAQYIMATPADSLSMAQTLSSISPTDSKSVVIVMATRIGMDDYSQAQPMPTAASLVMEQPLKDIDEPSPTIVSDNIAEETNADELQMIQDSPGHIQVNPSISMEEPLDDIFNALPGNPAAVETPTMVVPSEDEEGSHGVEDSTGEGESEEENLAIEPLPSPVALISPNGEGNNPPLEEEFAEAFKKVGQNGRRRRLRPGARRRVRMRVKKMNGTTTPLSVDGVSESEDESSASSASSDVSTRIGRRFRSTTPLPFLSSTFPSSFPPFPSSVVKSGPKPMIMKDVNSGNSLVTQEPQIEKPAAGGYTEKISTYFVSPPVQTTTTTKPPSDNKNASAEWLQSDHSKHHDMHHDNGHYMAERDNWEKNYMNLQQNSFYSASSEDVEPQTLASLNSDNDKKSKAVMKTTDGHIRESLEDRQYPDAQQPPFELRHPSGPSFPAMQKFSPFESQRAPNFDRTKDSSRAEESNFSGQLPTSYQNTEAQSSQKHPVAHFQIQTPDSPHHSNTDHSISIQQQGHHFGANDAHFHESPHHNEPHFSQDSPNRDSPNFKGSPLDPAGVDQFGGSRRPSFPGLGPNGFNIHNSPQAPAGYSQSYSHDELGKSPGPSGSSFGPPRNELHEQKPNPGGHSFQRQSGRVPKLVDAEHVHLPNYVMSPSGPEGPKRPTAEFDNVPNSPHLTLPMPGLVNVPTPPPESLAMNQVKPHRHFPPHTHSMSDRPDYEPANPPLPEGHVLQQHFDHFVQNAGEFKEIPQTNNGNHLNDFHNFNGPAQGAFSGDHQQRSPPEQNPESLQDPSRPYYEFGPPYYDKKPNNEQKYEQFSKNQNPSTNEHKGYGKPYHYSAEHQQDYEGYTPGAPPGPHNNFYGSANPQFPTSNVQIEQDANPQEDKIQDQEKKPGAGNPFSDVPYVLMFPQLVREDALRPAPPKLMTKEIPVVQASTMQAMPFTPEGIPNPLLGPGMTAVPVHPRHQMYQVLATAHYEKMMEKYVESKKKPPAAIYTPYGVLVPMGPAGAASSSSPQIIHNQNPHHHHHHNDMYESAYSHKQHKYHPKPTDEKQLLNLLLGAKLPPIGHVHFHKKSHLKGNRFSKHINLKANIEPALDLLAEKLAVKLAALEHILANQPKIGIHGSLVGGFGNPDGSYSELKPVKASPYEQNKKDANRNNNIGNSGSQQQQQQSSSNYYEQHQLPPSNGGQSSSPEFKSYLKKVLKERLTEVLEETHRDSHEQPRGPPHPSWLKFRPHHPPGRNLLGNNQHNLMPMQSMLMPQMSPPSRWPGPGSPAGGILGTIKRLFNFGGSINVNVGRSGDSISPLQGFTTGITNGTKTWANPNPLGGSYQHRSGLPTVMQPAQSISYNNNGNKQKKEGKSGTKKASKELEKWLDLVLKSTDTSISSSEKRSLMEQYPSSSAARHEEVRRMGKSGGGSSSSNSRKQSFPSSSSTHQFSLSSGAATHALQAKAFNPISQALSSGGGGDSSAQQQTQTATDAKISKRVDNIDEIELVDDPPYRGNSWKPILSSFFGGSPRSVFSFVTSPKKQAPTVLKPRAKSDSDSSAPNSSTAD